MNKVEKIIFACLGLVIICGGMVLCGWYYNLPILKTILPGFISMKSNTAIGLMCLAIASCLYATEKTKAKQTLAHALSFFILFFSILTLIEYAYGINFNIDEFFFQDLDAHSKWPPGRPAPITLLNFIFISSALILHSINTTRYIKITQGLMMIAWIASVQALVGYMSGNTYTFGSAFYTQIALHTALLFILITTANLLEWRNEGYLKYLSGDDVAGKVGRLLLLAAVIVPPSLNLLHHLGVRYQLFDSDFAVLIRVVGTIVCFAWMSMLTGKYLADVDGKRATAEKEQLIRTEELQRALQARDDLLSICSHELKTPISSMKLQTQFVQYQIERGDTDVLTPDKMLSIIAQSERQLDRLIKLIEDMLDFSRLNSGKFTLSKEEFDLHELIINILDSFKIQLKANQCELTLSVDVEKPILVYWDSYRIEQLVGNLINNAMKYGAKKPIEIKIFNDGNATGIQVRDQGMGILPGDVDRIFRPYERAISVSKISGLGLGLYISKKISDAHGGVIRVESVVGVGSTFTAVMPNKVFDKFEEILIYGS